MDHFTNEDDNFLHRIISDKQKGEGIRAVILKDDMKDVTSQVMAHWFNVKDGDLQAYMQKNFDSKWKVLDQKGMGQIEIEDGVKFVRDFIGGTIQL